MNLWIRLVHSKKFHVPVIPTMDITLLFVHLNHFSFEGRSGSSQAPIRNYLVVHCHPFLGLPWWEGYLLVKFTVSGMNCNQEGQLRHPVTLDWPTTRFSNFLFTASHCRTSWIAACKAPFGPSLITWLLSHHLPLCFPHLLPLALGFAASDHPYPWNIHISFLYRHPLFSYFELIFHFLMFCLDVVLKLVSSSSLFFWCHLACVLQLLWIHACCLLSGFWSCLKISEHHSIKDWLLTLYSYYFCVGIISLLSSFPLLSSSWNFYYANANVLTQKTFPSIYGNFSGTIPMRLYRNLNTGWLNVTLTHFRSCSIAPEYWRHKSQNNLKLVWNYD